MVLWLVIIFFSFSMLAPPNATAALALLVSAGTLRYFPALRAGAAIFFAGIAQLVEQLICNQQVVGSNPSAGFLV